MIPGIPCYVLQNGVHKASFVTHPSQFSDSSLASVHSFLDAINSYIDERKVSSAPISHSNASELWMKVCQLVYGNFTEKKKLEWRSSCFALTLTERQLREMVVPVLNNVDFAFHPEYLSCLRCHEGRHSTQLPCPACNGYGAVVQQGKEIYRFKRNH